MSGASELVVRAAVSDGAGGTTVRALRLPATASRIRVESSAVCGTDVMLHDHGLREPAVLGHHTIGRIDHLSPTDRDAVAIPVGTRVAVEEYVGCGTCADCRAGRYRFCPEADLWTGGQRVGMIPAGHGSGLHGGNAEYMEIGPRHALHPLPEHLSTELAAWTLPLANAVDWTLHAGGVGPGKTVAVIGPGYHGLSCVAAALAGGAATVISIGRPGETSDETRLGYARELGALSEVSDGGMLRRILDRHGPLDAVIDTIGHPSTVSTAVGLLGRFGVLVVAGIGGGDVTLDPTRVVRNLLTVRGVRGRAPAAASEAIRLLAEGTTRLDLVPTHEVALEHVGDTLNAMHQGAGPLTPHVVVNPWLRADGTTGFPPR